VLGLADSGQIINVIPETVNLENLRYEMSPQKRLVVTDRDMFSLDINEFTAFR
jgi:hypothetical protein